MIVSNIVAKRRTPRCDPLAQIYFGNAVLAGMMQLNSWGA
jgi:hypothetical protein